MRKMHQFFRLLEELMMQREICLMWLLVTDVWQLPAKEVLAPAPDFTMYTADGAAVKLSDYQGKPVVLNFWASWCGPCKMEMPDFQEKYEELGDEIQFLMVNLTDGSQETVETASAFISGQGYSFPVYYDTELNATRAYNANGLPVTFFIDAEGNFVAWQQGMMTAETLQIGIDMLLKS